MNNQSQPNTPHGGHGLSEDPLKPPLQGRRFTRNAWYSLRHWMRANTFVPSWLPPPLRHPVLGYLAAVMLEVIAVALTLLLIADMPAYSLPALLVVLAVVLVALNWGGGPRGVGADPGWSEGAPEYHWRADPQSAGTD